MGRPLGGCHSRGKQGCRGRRNWRLRVLNHSKGGDGSGECPPGQATSHRNTRKVFCPCSWVFLPLTRFPFSIGVCPAPPQGAGPLHPMWKASGFAPCPLGSFPSDPCAELLGSSSLHLPPQWPRPPLPTCSCADCVGLAQVQCLRCVWEGRTHLCSSALPSPRPTRAPSSTTSSRPYWRRTSEPS